MQYADSSSKPGIGEPKATVADLLAVDSDTNKSARNGPR